MVGGVNKRITYAGGTGNDVLLAPAGPDLTLSKENVGNDDDLVPGETVTYRLSYGNAADVGATGVTITETLPTGMTILLAENPGWTQIGATNQFSYTLGAVAGGASGTVDFIVHVADAVAGQTTIFNSSTIGDDGSNGPEVNAEDNTATDTDSLVANATFTITKSDGTTIATPGATLTYAINYANIGNQGATGVLLTETLPGGTTFLSSENPGWTNSAGVLTFTVGSLAAGAGGSAPLVLHVSSPAAAGLDSIANTVTIADDGANGAASQSATDTDTLDAAPDLAITSKSDGVSSTVPGATLTYTIAYSNIGNQGATGVILTDNLPVGTTFVAAENPGWSNNAGLLTFTVGALAAGANGSAPLVLHVAAVAAAGQHTIVNSATISDDDANGLDPAGNDSATDTDTLVAAPDLQLVSISNGTTTVVPGNTLTYTISYQNHGNQDATGVTITETLPAGTIFIAAENPGWTLTGNTLTYVIGSVTAGGPAPIIERFDGVAAPALPVGWSSSSGSGSQAWITSTGSFSTEPNAAFVPDVGMVTDTYLNSPIIAIPSSLGQQISFKNSYNLEPGFDGGVLEIAIDGGAFSDIVAAGGSFVTGGYNRTISASEASPIGGRMAWSANSSGFIDSVANLPASTLGHNVQFRWRMATDGSISAPGWRIDDVTFIAGLAPSTIGLKLVVVDPAAAGQETVVSTASIADDATNGADPTADNSATDTDILDAAPDLELTSISDGTTVVVPGATILYVVQATNIGNQGATGVVLTETVPAGTTFNAGASSPGWVAQGGGVYTFAVVGELSGAGGAISTTFAVDVVSPAASGRDFIASTVSIADDGTNGADLTANNSATDTDTLDAAPDLHVTKTTAIVSTKRGGVIPYDVRYSNEGNQDATGAYLIEHLPENSSFSAADSTPGWALQGDGTYRFDIGDLPAGAAPGSVTFAVKTTRLLPGGVLTIDNQVDLHDDLANGADPDLTDDLATTSTPIYQGIYAVAADRGDAKLKVGRGAPPAVRVFDVATNTELAYSGFLAYEARFKLGVRVAVGDVNGDGYDDIITAAAKGTGRIRAFDGLTGDRIAFGNGSLELNPFSARSRDGAYIAAGDVNGDGFDDLVIGEGFGGSHVLVVDGLSGATTDNLTPFASIPGATAKARPRSFTGGVRVAVGDVNGDGIADIITSMGAYGSRVKVLAGSMTDRGEDRASLHDFETGGKSGVHVAVGDINSDGFGDLIVGQGGDQSPRVRVFSGSDGTLLLNIAPFGEAPPSPAVVRVAAVDYNLDGIADIIVGTGTRGGSQVRIFDGRNGDEITNFAGFSRYPAVGLFVAGSSPVPLEYETVLPPP